jgi:MerR family transcriptional regulator, redox-sensitive transcriptional activator SoxR
VNESLPIGEIARRAGVQPSALRYYERVGLLKAPRRVSGQRRYSPNVLDTLRVVALAQAAGFTIAEIRELLRGFDCDTPWSERWRPLAQEKLRQVQERIDRARRMERLLHALLECQCTQLDDCVRYCGPPSASCPTELG